MKRIEDIHEVQNILLNIAKEFHQICVDNNIPYYMLDGTMLGAVRHKGFIPWDDDMDFGVERKYLPILEKIFNENPSSHIRFISSKNSKKIINDPIKIEDTRTLIIEPDRAHINEDMGLNIDVFPLDLSNGDKHSFSKNNCVHILANLNSMRICNMKILPLSHKVLAMIIRIALAPFPKSFLNSLALRFFIKKDGDHLSNLYGYWGTKEVMPRDVMGIPVLYTFENIKLYGPENSGAYLKRLYGDYLELPPEEKRHVHLAEAYIK